MVVARNIDGGVRGSEFWSAPPASEALSGLGPLAVVL